ncbi:hypothetical protein BDK51DRAFT_26987 [Blyttiomyces helicus]|uniref:Uncharacterized protein n=1 Tax=Blyttiomyces helicus TaxID=388810 RepID=A0A4P9W1H8_9FUNG|nr:hypothetical protein BDK51DRAFT_26987 [Blyttiomyces helicus]|eukprot:RKO84588.1 hypothetical protein BDK51DRAFT_26987 [Blyttiomyces helicus]
MYSRQSKGTRKDGTLYVKRVPYESGNYATALATSSHKSGFHECQFPRTIDKFFILDTSVVKSVLLNERKALPTDPHVAYVVGKKTMAEIKNDARTATLSLPGYIEELSNLIIGFTQDRQTLMFRKMYEGKFMSSYLNATRGHQSWVAFNDHPDHANCCSQFVIYCEAILLARYIAANRTGKASYTFLTFDFGQKEIAAFLKSNDRASLQLVAEKRDIDLLTLLYSPQQNSGWC